MYASMLLVMSLSASQAEVIPPIPTDGSFQPVAAAMETPYRTYEPASAPANLPGNTATGYSYSAPTQYSGGTQYSGTNYTGMDPWSAPAAGDWVGPGANCECDSWWGRCCNRCFGCWGHGGPCSCCSTCDLFPHYPYYPEHHGYYYFRPYNYVHIFEHQAIVARWGGDARNPYSHELFTRLYDNLPVAPPTPYVPGLRGIRAGLPDLEDLVPKKADVPTPPAPGGEE